MLAHSIYSDDAKAIAYSEEGRQMLGPFNLGGLDGHPFVGLTGMAAFAHHAPDDVAAPIFYAPHIGLTAQGKLGKILRVGQPSPSSCCGAAVAALEQMRDSVDLPATPARRQLPAIQSSPHPANAARANFVRQISIAGSRRSHFGSLRRAY